MSDLYSIPEVREHAELIVRNEVHYCVSHLISQILQAPDTWRELGIDEDDAYMLAEIEDFESAALEHIEDADADDLRDFLADRDVDFEEGTEDDDGDMVGSAPLQNFESSRVKRCASNPAPIASIATMRALTPNGPKSLNIGLFRTGWRASSRRPAIP